MRLAARRREPSAKFRFLPCFGIRYPEPVCKPLSSQVVVCGCTQSVPYLSRADSLISRSLDVQILAEATSFQLAPDPADPPFGFLAAGGKIVGHSSEAIYHRYSITNDADVREALAKVAALPTRPIRRLAIGGGNV